MSVYCQLSGPVSKCRSSRIELTPSPVEGPGTRAKPDPVGGPGDKDIPGSVCSPDTLVGPGARVNPSPVVAQVLKLTQVLY